MGKIKLQIKSVLGKVLFEYETEENTIKKTLCEALEKDAYLQGAYLQGAYLQGANLQGANLQGAYLQGANLQGANLQEANLQGANLQEANLQEANLQEANLRGAYLQGANLQEANLQLANLQGAYLRLANLQGVKIKKATVITGVYKYHSIPFISEQDIQYVKMGCFTRTREEWDKDFWNNKNEFPNNGNLDSELRKLAYDTCCRWLDMQIVNDN